MVPSHQFTHRRIKVTSPIGAANQNSLGRPQASATPETSMIEKPMSA